MKNKKYYLGLDVGGTNLAAAIVDDNYQIIERLKIPSNAHRSTAEIIDNMVEVSRGVVAKSGLEISQISSWGIGMPSCINIKTNLLVHANCFGWKNMPIYDHLEGKLPLPFFIENDANCAVYGEALAGAAQGYKDVLMLTLGTGVGGGIIIDGKIYTGADNMGAELGHTKLVYDGELCTCGQKGCLEAYCSLTALLRVTKKTLKLYPQSDFAKMVDEQNIEFNGEIIFEAAKKGDPTASGIIEQYIKHLAAGLSTFITIFRPSIIVLGGGIANSGDFLFNPLREEVYKATFGADMIGVPPIVGAKLGNDAGIIGAALLEQKSKIFNKNL